MKRLKVQNLTKCMSCKQKRGGRMKFTSKGWICEDCITGPRMRDMATNPFQFESGHITGDPNLGKVQVQGLRHLRSLEKQYGVISVLANYDRPNDPIRGGKEQFRDRGQR